MNNKTIIVPTYLAHNRKLHKQRSEVKISRTSFFSTASTRLTWIPICTLMDSL